LRSGEFWRLRVAKRLLILGGYGNTGRLIAEYLVQETDVALVLAGRSLEKASVLAAELDSRCEVPRVAGIRLDASDAQALEAAFSKVDLVVVAASSMDHVAQVAKAALQTGTDYLVMPLAAAGIRLFGRRAAPLMGRMLFWSLCTFSKPPYRTVLKLEASGIRHGKPVSFSLMLSHEDAYVLTAVPVVACLLQYLEGQLPLTGLWTQANIVEPERFLRDIGRMGIRLEPPLSMLAV